MLSHKKPFKDHLIDTYVGIYMYERERERERERDQNMQISFGDCLI